MISDRDYQGDIMVNYHEGILKLDLASWQEFPNLVKGRSLGRGSFIWRGQRSPDWRLESSWERLRKKLALEDPRQCLKFFADREKKRDTPEILAGDDDYWASGQHYGSVTPLLEWTSTPFSAAFFAFCRESDEQDKRAVYALALDRVKVINNVLKLKTSGEKGEDLLIKFINPSFGDNSRLADKGGLFTKAPTGTDLEEWVRKNYALTNQHNPVLVKITLPNSERNTILKVLKRMNFL